MREQGILLGENPKTEANPDSKLLGGFRASHANLLLFPFEKSANLHHCMLVKPKSVRLFIKPYCGWCHKAERWLDSHGIDYQKVDVMADEAAYDEMIKLSGQDLAPVLDVDGEILADFGPDQLADFWKRLTNARLETR